MTGLLSGPLMCLAIAGGVTEGPIPPPVREAVAWQTRLTLDLDRDGQQDSAWLGLTSEKHVLVAVALSGDVRVEPTPSPPPSPPRILEFFETRAGNSRGMLQSELSSLEHTGLSVATVGGSRRLPAEALTSIGCRGDATDTEVCMKQIANRLNLVIEDYQRQLAAPDPVREILVLNDQQTDMIRIEWSAESKALFWCRN